MKETASPATLEGEGNLAKDAHVFFFVSCMWSARACLRTRVEKVTRDKK